MIPRFHIALDGQAAVDQEKGGGRRQAGGGKNEKFLAWGQRSSKALENRRFQGEKNCFGVRGQKKEVRKQGEVSERKQTRKQYLGPPGLLC